MGEAYEVIEKDSNREAWLLARRSLITASDMPAVLGMTRDEHGAFGSRLAVYATKIGATGELDLGERAYWGNQLERQVAEAFEQHSLRYCAQCQRTWTWRGELPARWEKMEGLRLSPSGNSWSCTKCRKVARGPKVTLCGELLRSTSMILRHLGATPDFWIDWPWGGRGVLQCKTVDFMQEARHWGDGIPAATKVQNQTEMLVSGCRTGAIAALIGGNKWVFQETIADPILHDQIRVAADEFLQLVEARTPPDTDGSESCAAAVRAVYATVETPFRLLKGDQWQRAHTRIAELRKRARDTEGELRGLITDVFAAIGDAEVGRLDDGCTFTLAANVHGVRSLRCWDKPAAPGER